MYLSYDRTTGVRRSTVALYDKLGRTYSATRHADPRIAAIIATALADNPTVINIGAGTGSYEPVQTVAAIEPSLVMISQRPAGAAPAIQAAAEHIPLRDDCVDAALAVLDPTVQAGMSLFAKTDQALLRPGLTRLAADLASGRWHNEHGELLDLDELDLGYRVVTAAP
jgi:hypothetical protein